MRVAMPIATASVAVVVFAEAGFGDAEADDSGEGDEGQEMFHGE
jgi:hypothetical protein